MCVCVCVCVCWVMVEVTTFLLKHKGLGPHIGRVYDCLYNVRRIEKKMYGKEYFPFKSRLDNST